MDEKFELVEETVVKQKTFVQTLKENAINITVGIATVAITGWAYYSDYKRSNRKEEKYNDYLDAKIDIFERDARWLHNDSLDSERPTNNDYPQDDV